MAIVAKGNRERIYLPPSDEHVAIADKAIPHGVPETDLPEKALRFRRPTLRHDTTSSSLYITPTDSR